MIKSIRVEVCNILTNKWRRNQKPFTLVWIILRSMWGRCTCMHTGKIVTTDPNSMIYNRYWKPILRKCIWMGWKIVNKIIVYCLLSKVKWNNMQNKAMQIPIGTNHKPCYKWFKSKELEEVLDMARKINSWKSKSGVPINHPFANAGSQFSQEAGGFRKALFFCWQFPF